MFGDTLDAYVFEDIALHLSSMLLSLFVVMWGFALQWRIFPTSIRGEPRVFWAAGLLGAAATAWALVGYHRRVQALVKLADRELAEPGRSDRSSLTQIDERHLSSTAPRSSGSSEPTTPAKTSTGSKHS